MYLTLGPMRGTISALIERGGGTQPDEAPATARKGKVPILARQSRGR